MIPSMRRNKDSFTTIIKVLQVFIIMPVATLVIEDILLTNKQKHL